MSVDAANGEDATPTGSDLTTVATCGVQVDKQVSCGELDENDDLIWYDVGFDDTNPPAAAQCLALSDEQISVRYVAKNTGSSCALTGCELTESNGSFGSAGTFGLTDGQTTTPEISGGSEACETAFGDPNDPEEPNTVSISCDTAIVGDGKATDSDQAFFACLTAAPLVDRNVTCPTSQIDTLVQDDELTETNGDSTNGCTTLDGQPVDVGYQYCNNGTAPLYSCRLTDDNELVSATPVVPEFDLPVSRGRLCYTPSGCDRPLLIWCAVRHSKLQRRSMARSHWSAAPRMSTPC